jgi:murein DD-endopeptidase MepM/ murein hydrolase activator NlpD
MQLMWLSTPLGDWKTFNVSRKRVVVLAVGFALTFLTLGNLLHFVGLRLAVEYRPDLVRLIGGVMTLSDLEKLDDSYRARLEAMRQELAAAGQQVAELRGLKESFMQLAMPPQPAPPIPGAPFATDPPKAGAQERRRGSLGALGGLGGPWREGPFDPAQVASADLSGSSLFEDFDLSRRELRSFKQWLRQARSDWSTQLDWVESQPTGVPILGPAQITSRVGMRTDPFTHLPARHDGLDLVAPPGTPILAAASGEVLRAQRHPQYGLMVDLDHGNGYMTRYAHAQQLLVKTGDTVKRGMPIATVGSTGRSTGPHLHFEIHHKGALRDPERFISAALQRASAGSTDAATPQ